jgi:hypothetical protein
MLLVRLCDFFKIHLNDDGTEDIPGFSKECNKSIITVGIPEPIKKGFITYPICPHNDMNEQLNFKDFLKSVYSLFGTYIRLMNVE